MNLAEDSGRSAPISAAGEPTPLSSALPAQPLVDGGTSPPGGPHSPHKLAASAAFSKRLMEAGRADAGAVLEMMKSASDGLTTAAAADRLAEIGPNTVAEEVAFGAFRRMLRAARNPLVILLTIIAAVSFWTGDFRGGVVISIMVVLGISLRFLQESRADAAAAKLKAMIRVSATVVRQGEELEVPLAQLVPGDVVSLAAGDMIPADLRIVSCKDLFVVQSALTGESLPAEKHSATETRPEISALEFGNLAFLGSSVESGSARAVVVETGSRTYFGSLAHSLAEEPLPTSFDKGLGRFTWLMIRFMMVMVPLVFLVNGLTKHNWREAFFFAVAVAVGLTPEMLPMIVSVCLSKGALAMSKRRVIVKQLSAIQNFGAMDVLCTDKTGTLTMDRIILERYCDVLERDDERVLLDGYLLSHFQTGLRNVLDRAILKRCQDLPGLATENYRKLDELPFDFKRRMMSVCLEAPDKSCVVLTKGAPEAVFERCDRYELDGKVSPMDPAIVASLTEKYCELSADGFRVLAVAYKPIERRDVYSKDDERELILRGYLAFLDPPKDSATAAIAALRGHGVRVKVLTGDNELVTRKVCREVGIASDKIVLGRQVDAMSDADLGKIVDETDIFARLDPAAKQRVVAALRARGHVVGYLGDGINDAPALRAADVGISVDSAVDIAKECASVILLENSLTALDDGVIEGRKVFVNILKYVRMGASSNFGNMFSVLGASAFLPFIPMAPIQILTNNLLYDFSQVPIPTDNVGPEQTARPRPWQIGELTRFILFIGPISSIFDYTTFFVMLYVFDCWDPARASLFQTGWFVESLMTQTLIIHVIRTNKVPFFEGSASWQLTLTSLLVMALAAWLPYSPLASTLGFTPLPLLYWPILLVTLVCYVVLTQLVKMWLIRKSWL